MKQSITSTHVGLICSRSIGKSSLWFLLLTICAVVLHGCAGGYAGGTIPTISASQITIDAGQSVTIAASNPSNFPLEWTVSGAACTGAACGTLTSGSNTGVTYAAPQQVTQQVTVTLQALLTATQISTTTTIIVNPAPKISGTLPAGTPGTAYSATLSVTGGTGTSTWNPVKGSLPAGLTFNTSTGVISGTPTTIGVSNFTVEAVDQSAVPYTSSAAEQISIGTAGTALSASDNAPTGLVGSAYTTTLVATGGTAPYTWLLVSGSLPSGLTLSTNGIISGTPTVVGSSTFTVQVKDATGTTVTMPVTITIGSPRSLLLTTSNLPSGTVGIPYSAIVGVGGGSSPYTCTIVSGSLPAGLSFGAGCVVTGTPTVAGISTPVIHVSDSSNPAITVTAPITLTINAAPSNIQIASPPAATVNTLYTGTIPVTGGTAPYTCVLLGGTMPAGLSLNSSCQITGTPTTPVVTTISVKATDSSSPSESGSGPVVLTVNAATSTLTIGAPPKATVLTPYTGIIPVTGGTGPYQCALASGTMPAGLSLGAGCVISGTPTVAGTTTVSITALDSSSPANTNTSPVVITVDPIATLTLTGSLPNATLQVAYTQTLHASGGVAPYTYAITAGALPAGLSLSTGGIISGTPTAVGASSFTVTATDSESTPQTASLPLVLLVVYPDTPYDGLLKGPYAFLFQGYDDVAVGLLAYQTSTIGSFTADGMGALTAGELDSNHQTSNPTGNTVANSGLLGTYTLGADGRGTIAVTTLNTDGTTAATTLYSIAVKLPTAPATVATQGSLIEADDNQLVGTKGSGTLLAQTTAAYATGLTGNYAFGLSGDTPCLPSCTLGLIAGPVASVGQVAANNGILSGVGDANIATTNYASSTLSGAYAPADGNGRVQVTLNTSKLASVAYPTDYALYMVDASHAFLMSTDKHSSYILQAGTAQSQTTGSFNNASLNGPYVGFENAAVNPGLVNQTLSNVLNLSSATIFRGTGNSNGTCTTTNVDEGGLTGLVSALTGLGSNSGLVNAVLGTYQSLGTSNCTVAANGRAVLEYPAPNSILATTLALLGLGNTPPPARVAYLTGANQGYFLETGYAGLGQLAAQSGAPFSLASLNGTYVYGSVPASTLVTINGAGSFQADGSGNATSTIDRNIGVGNLNVLDLNDTSTSTYTLTDATAGRYLLGGTRVIYAIAPGRFVLMDTDALGTSPFIAQLY